MVENYQVIDEVQLEKEGRLAHLSIQTLQYVVLI
jgi:hypothetical protein